MRPEQFRDLMEPVMTAIADGPVDQQLAARLNATFAPSTETFKAIEQACHEAIAAGWMCSQGSGQRRYGRVIAPEPATHGLSVDVVDLTDVVGPHHRHPNGEICMVMPQSLGAEFNGHGAGWAVFEPGSAHHPTVTGGEALVLYLLPGGAIEFTG